MKKLLTIAVVLVVGWMVYRYLYPASATSSNSAAPVIPIATSTAALAATMGGRTSGGGGVGFHSGGLPLAFTE
jgi:hypothetical protein